MDQAALLGSAPAVLPDVDPFPAPHAAPVGTPGALQLFQGGDPEKPQDVIAFWSFYDAEWAGIEVPDYSEAVVLPALTVDSIGTHDRAELITSPQALDQKMCAVMAITCPWSRRCKTDHSQTFYLYTYDVILMQRNHGSQCAT